MKKNEGTIDRVVRIFIAVVAVVVGMSVLDGAWSIVAYVVAAVMAFTAIAGMCPLYKVFGINTCKIS